MIHENQTQQILQKGKTVANEVLVQAMKEAQKQNKNLSDYLVDSHIISEKELYETLGKHFQVPFVDLANKQVEDEYLEMLPEAIAHSHQVVIFDATDQSVSVAMLDPDDLQIIDFIKKRVHCAVKPYITTPSGLSNVLKQYHRDIEDTFEAITEQIQPTLNQRIDLGKQTIQSKIETNKNEEDPNKLKELSKNLPVIKIVDTLLEYAIFENASDIHIEPSEKDVIVRYRVDGILKDVMTLPKSVQTGIIARIKVLSNLKLDEHRLPQDGRFKIESAKYKLSFRVSVIPVYDGEKIVLRLLDESKKIVSLEKIGLQLGPEHVVRQNIKKPHGMVLVTGPTGSGKTTTLYSILGILNSAKVNICTIEDPIEYRMQRTNQSQINPKIGFTFASGLRALLRQDPNIIMVGEIRDEETAEISAHAAMTGHLLLSTLHTNDAVGTLARLQEMGIPPYLVASMTNCIVAQRLVRILCPLCKKSMVLDEKSITQIKKQYNLPEILKTLQKEQEKTIHSLADVPFYKPTGCKACNQEGYKRRIGIFEVLEITPEVSRLILENKPKDILYKSAKQQGMISIVEDGFIKAARGITSIEEILRVTKE